MGRLKTFIHQYPALSGLMITIGSVYLIQIGVASFAGGQLLYRVLGLSRVDFIGNFAWFQPLTYQFLHSPGDFLHPLMNLFILWMTGRELEPVLGKVRFTVFFLSAGFFAGLIHILFSPAYVIGASGSVFALLIVYALTWPDRTILAFFIIPMKMRYFAILLMGMQLLFAFTSRMSGISHYAHLGGGAGGLLLYLLYRKTGFFRKLEQYNRERRMRRHENRIRKKREEQERVDQLLDKISAKGIDSLSKRERRFLDRAGSHMDLPPDGD